jgi:hypothetical protein
VVVRSVLAGFAVALALLFAACSGGDDDGGGSSANNREVIQSLPAHPGSTLVREWEVGTGNDASIVREFSTETEPPLAGTVVTMYFIDRLKAAGWEETQPVSAAVSSFTKGGSQVVLGRIGPELMEAPAGANVTQRAEVPAAAKFFYTLEVKARQ